MYDESQHPRDDHGRWTDKAISIVTRINYEGKIKVVGVYEDAEEADKDGTDLAEKYDRRAEYETPELVEIHDIELTGEFKGTVDIVSTYDDLGGGVDILGAYADPAKAKAAFDKAVKDKWAKDGPDLDDEDIPEKEWESWRSAWNKDHQDHPVPKSNYKVNDYQAFHDHIESKYLAGKKSPFPSVAKANAYFEDRYGTHIQLASNKKVKLAKEKPGASKTTNEFSRAV